VPLSNSLRLLTFAWCAASLLGQSPPAGFEQTDFDIRIGVLPGQLRFDKEHFTVAPGSKVKLTLRNTDAMQHNLVLCAQGKGVAAKVAAATLQLGASASEKHYVPDLDEVLASTKAIFLDQSDTIWFRAPQQAGDYAYVCTLPGHSFTMKGVMHVGAGKEPGGAVPIANLRYRVFRGRWQQLPDFAALTPFREGDLDDGLLQLAPLGERKDYGVVFTGSIEVARAGQHTFFLNSDDGSRVLVDDREVVAHDGVHPANAEQRGSVALTAGAHQLRVEFFQGGGGQVLKLALAGPDGKRRKLWTRQAKAARVTPIAVHHHPVVLRVHVEGASARTIAVGLTGGMNYAFDAERCAVQFGWAGAFLDVGPDRDGRGGRPCKTLGPRFGVGDVGFPLRRADGRARPVRFRGYRTRPMPTFDLDWDGTATTWSVGPAAVGVGLAYTFTFAEPLADAVRFCIDPKGLQVASRLGALQNGFLTVPAGTRTFSVTVGNPEVVR
jgi:azurin